MHLQSGEVLRADTVISAVGNQPVPLIRASGLPLERGRIKVDSDMRVVGYQNVWALGDCAAVPNAYSGLTCPMLAQHALRQAKQLAKNIHAHLHGQPTRPFYLHNQISESPAGEGPRK